jgi:hypothetical protein
VELASTTPIFPHGVNRDDFTFNFLQKHAITNCVGDDFGLVSVFMLSFYILQIYLSLLSGHPVAQLVESLR